MVVLLAQRCTVVAGDVPWAQICTVGQDMYRGGRRCTVEAGDGGGASPEMYRGRWWGRRT